jgi:gamma-glutamyltranspeptidase/glutathione hydrolase
LRTQVVVGFSLYVLFPSAVSRAATPAPLIVAAKRGVVAADNADASRAGAEMLAHGGNAVDAAVAAALALGVVGPTGSGLGGGGFLIYWKAGEQKAYALDFREVAPAAATADMFLKAGPSPDLSRAGGLAVAVPGEPAGLDEAETRFGRLGLKAVVQPAVRLARDGFHLSALLAKVAPRFLPMIPKDSGLLAWLQPGGRTITQSDRIVRPHLAATLARFGTEGRRVIYQGRIAEALVADVRARGGILTTADLAGYKPMWREPAAGRFRGYQLYGVGAPGGGVTVIEALQILDAGPSLAPLGLGSSAALHRIAEALKHAFADRARLLGDPGFAPDVAAVSREHLLDPGYARGRAGTYDEHKALGSDAYGAGRASDAKPAARPEPAHDHGTSHVCVVDGEGNVAALTTTINLPFGARFEEPQSGLILNDEMDDFNTRPGRPNGFGLFGSTANEIAPGKRPMSSMSPLILVKDGKARMCVGGSGGPTIVSSTVQSVVNVVDFGLDAEAAVAQPRIHVQWMPPPVFVEPEIPRDVVEGLERRGQSVKPAPDIAPPASQVIVIHDETVEAASDPRKGGAPAAP